MIDMARGKANATKSSKSWEPGKHPGGRPRKYTSVAKMEQDIQAYFDGCWRQAVGKDGQPIVDTEGKPIMEQYKPYTITGLANALDMDRDTLLRYEGDERYKEFHGTVTRAKRKVQEYVESCLFDRNAARGAEFNLKNNFGWIDRQEIDQKVTNTTQDMSPEDRRAKIVELTRKQAKG